VFSDLPCLDPELQPGVAITQESTLAQFRGSILTEGANVTEERIRILVVESHCAIREGLVELLEMNAGLEVVGEAANGQEAIEQFHKNHPDITLIDLRIPERLGVQVIKRILLESPSAQIIVLTTFEDDEDLPCALEAGAQTYLLNGMAADELVATIRAVHAGALQALTPVELALDFMDERSEFHSRPE
jgi:DNA-binding NarL/FixJ family response regulator